MAETQTPNYHWTKPDLGGDAAVWGNVLNSSLDAVDAVTWANQSASVPVGTILMYAGKTLPPNGTSPTNWMWCNGGVYLDTDVPLLAPVLKPGGVNSFPGGDATHTALPNLNGRFPVGYDAGGWSMGLTGGEANHTLTVNEMPVHAHSASQDAHSHSASQDAHAHWLGLPAHSHSVTQDNHVHYDSGHSHGASGSQDAHTHGGPFVAPGSGSWNLTTPSLQQVNQSGTSYGASANAVYVSVGNGAAQLGGVSANAVYCDTFSPAANTYATDARQPGTYTGGASANAVYIGNQGSGAAANNMPPYTTVGFIIRYR